MVANEVGSTMNLVPILQAMMRNDGPYAEFRKLFRIFDDTRPEFESNTIARGGEVIDQPYLNCIGMPYTH